MVRVSRLSQPRVIQHSLGGDLELDASNIKAWYRKQVGQPYPWGHLNDSVKIMYDMFPSSRSAG